MEGEAQLREQGIGLGLAASVAGPGEGITSLIESIKDEVEASRRMEGTRKQSEAQVRTREGRSKSKDDY